jgi:hypothetical protein
MYVFVLIVMVMKWLARAAGISGRMDRPAGLALYAMYALAVLKQPWARHLRLAQKRVVLTYTKGRK